MITNGKVVSLAYSLKNAAGAVLDAADKNDPFAYMHGAHQIVPGLERALEGMAQGEKKLVEVAPADGYGEHDPRMILTVERSAFPANVKIEAGMQFQGGAESGQPSVFTIHKIEGDAVTVNGNHPLAGETLFFEVEVLAVRDATQEEISHGHAHPGDGHHHHH